MAEIGAPSPVKAVQYDSQADILIFSFTETPRSAVTEEAADEVWVRYDPETHQVISVDMLNFSASFQYFWRGFEKLSGCSQMNVHTNSRLELSISRAFWLFVGRHSC